MSEAVEGGTSAVRTATSIVGAVGGRLSTLTRYQDDENSPSYMTPIAAVTHNLAPPSDT